MEKTYDKVEFSNLDMIFRKKFASELFKSAYKTGRGTTISEGLKDIKEQFLFSTAVTELYNTLDDNDIEEIKRNQKRIKRWFRKDVYTAFSQVEVDQKKDLKEFVNNLNQRITEKTLKEIVDIEGKAKSSKLSSKLEKDVLIDLLKDNAKIIMNKVPNKKIETTKYPVFMSIIHDYNFALLTVVVDDEESLEIYFGLIPIKQIVALTKAITGDYSFKFPKTVVFVPYSGLNEDITGQRIVIVGNTVYTGWYDTNKRMLLCGEETAFKPNKIDNPFFAITPHRIYKEEYNIIVEIPLLIDVLEKPKDSLAEVPPFRYKVLNYGYRIEVNKFSLGVKKEEYKNNINSFQEVFLYGCPILGEDFLYYGGVPLKLSDEIPGWFITDDHMNPSIKNNMYHIEVNKEKSRFTFKVINCGFMSNPTTYIDVNEPFSLCNGMGRIISKGVAIVSGSMTAFPWTRSDKVFKLYINTESYEAKVDNMLITRRGSINIVGQTEGESSEYLSLHPSAIIEYKKKYGIAGDRYYSIPIGPEGPYYVDKAELFVFVPFANVLATYDNNKKVISFGGDIYVKEMTAKPSGYLVYLYKINDDVVNNLLSKIETDKPVTSYENSLTPEFNNYTWVVKSMSNFKRSYYRLVTSIFEIKRNHSLLMREYNTLLRLMPAFQIMNKVLLDHRAYDKDALEYKSAKIYDNYMSDVGFINNYKDMNTLAKIFFDGPIDKKVTADMVVNRKEKLDQRIDPILFANAKAALSSKEYNAFYSIKENKAPAINVDKKKSDVEVVNSPIIIPDDIDISPENLEVLAQETKTVQTIIEDKQKTNDTLEDMEEAFNQEIGGSGGVEVNNDDVVDEIQSSFMSQIKSAKEKVDTFKKDVEKINQNNQKAYEKSDNVIQKQNQLVSERYTKGVKNVVADNTDKKYDIRKTNADLIDVVSSSTFDTRHMKEDTSPEIYNLLQLHDSNIRQNTNISKQTAINDSLDRLMAFLYLLMSRFEKSFFYDGIMKLFFSNNQSFNYIKHGDLFTKNIDSKRLIKFLSTAFTKMRKYHMRISTRDKPKYVHVASIVSQIKMTLKYERTLFEFPILNQIFFSCGPSFHFKEFNGNLTQDVVMKQKQFMFKDSFPVNSAGYVLIHSMDMKISVNIRPTTQEINITYPISSETYNVINASKISDIRATSTDISTASVKIVQQDVLYPLKRGYTIILFDHTDPSHMNESVSCDQMFMLTRFGDTFQTMKLADINVYVKQIMCVLPIGYYPIIKEAIDKKCSYDEILCYCPAWKDNRICCGLRILDGPTIHDISDSFSINKNKKSMINIGITNKNISIPNTHKFFIALTQRMKNDVPQTDANIGDVKSANRLLMNFIKQTILGDFIGCDERCNTQINRDAILAAFQISGGGELNQFIDGIQKVYSMLKNDPVTSISSYADWNMKLAKIFFNYNVVNV